MEAFADNIVVALNSLVTSEHSRLTPNFIDHLKKIKDEVISIRRLLGIAEQAAENKNPVIIAWLESVKAVLYDVDDLVDEFSADDFRKEVMTKTRMTQRIFFCHSNQVALRPKMGHRIREIKKKLSVMDGHDIYSNKLPEFSVNYGEQRQTDSFVTVDKVIGREEERKLLLSHLRDSSMKENVSVISIVGIAGSGKTTLAQLVYNDEAVQRYFDLKMWVNVSPEFDVKKIATEVVAREQNIVEAVEGEVLNKVEGKRFLLVLDDVWNTDRQLWLDLESLLKGGAVGSKIIVTTRDEKVANVMKARFSISLRRLDDQLRLSYDHLPPYMKNCFAYCSLFPKDYVIQKETLIQLWVAQGYIQSTKNQSAEDVGVEYFTELLARSFFQVVDSDRYGDISTCKMHYLIHDLAALVAGEDYTVFKGTGESMGSRTRHVSCGFGLKPESSIPTSLLRRTVRTFLLPCQPIPDYGLLLLGMKTGSLLVAQQKSRLYDTISTSLISSLKRARVLDLHHLDIVAIPESIGELKHLRYIDLSENVYLKKLPQAITRLHYLQTLKLSSCFSLQELPSDIGKLVSLRHLGIDNCISLTCMPHGLGRLTSLRTLSQFVVDKSHDNSSAQIDELAGMHDLRGSLIIRGLKHLRDDLAGFKFASLLVEKEHLRELELIWPNEVTQSNFVEEFADKDEAILQWLQPHHTIKRLRIEGFSGKTLPNWIANLSSLQELAIHFCKNLASLPETMYHLPSLDRLIISRCPLLKQRYGRQKSEEW